MNLKHILCFFTILSLSTVSHGSLFGTDGASANIEKHDNNDKVDNTNSDLLDIQTDLIVLNENNVVTIRGAINPKTTNKFIHDIHMIDTEDIYIYLTTPGGSVIHGYQIIQIIDALESMGKNVHCIADYAYSMGFSIMQSCPTRYSMIGSSIMQHQMSFGIKGQLENNKNRMEFIEEIDNQMTERQSAKLGLTVDEFKEKTLSDWWIFGTDIVKTGAADKMANVFCDKMLVEKVYTEEYDLMFFGKIYVDFSECPLISDPLKVYTKDDESNSITEITDNEKLEDIRKEIKNSKEMFFH